MEDQEEETESLGVGQEEQQKEKEDANTLQFLDSVDGYLTLLDSLSSTLRQGWLELASARHSMGASRLNSSMLDLKFHSAATSLQVSESDVESMATQPHFALRKWASPGHGRCYSEDAKSSEDKLQRKSDSAQLLRRSKSQFSEIQDKTPVRNGASVTVDDQVQKERSKSLSVFGTLVSPKLRASQLTFETALEMLVETANMRSSMLSSFDEIQKGRKSWKAKGVDK